LLAPLLADPVKAIRMAAGSRLASVDSELLEEYQRQDLENSLLEYRETMEAGLDFASSALNLGALAARQGDSAEAERYLRIALRVDDRFTPARANLAILLAGQGRDAESEQLLREGTRLTPDDAEPWRMLGLLLASSSEPLEAVAPLETALELDPGDTRTHYNLGLLLQELDRATEAELHLRAALELEPRSPDFLYALADHYLKRGRYDQVLPLADRLTEVLPDQPVGAQLRAIAERAGN
jgi:tetratricopeptide (TPR) repeat protein